jgi:hypothetical protein
MDLYAAGSVPRRGEAAFEPRSRRPKSSPNAINPETVELIIGLRKELAGQGLDAGPETILLAPDPSSPHHGVAGHHQPPSAAT